MFPWKKRSRMFDDDFFGDLDEEFREMEENIVRMFDEMRRMPSGDPEESGQYVYGFSMKVGPEGKPVIEEFGNIPGMGSEGGIPEGREPLTDVIEGENEVSVVAELPGIEQKDIGLDVGEDSLEITVDTPERKYRKRLVLPCKVKPDKAESTFKNGVLEVKMERAGEE